MISWRAFFSERAFLAGFFTIELVKLFSFVVLFFTFYSSRISVLLSVLVRFFFTFFFLLNFGVVFCFVSFIFHLQVVES